MKPSISLAPLTWMTKPIHLFPCAFKCCHFQFRTISHKFQTYLIDSHSDCNWLKKDTVIVKTGHNARKGAAAY